MGIAIPRLGRDLAWLSVILDSETFQMQTFQGTCSPDPSISGIVERRSANDLSDAEFRACYAGRAPVILTLENWVNPDEWSVSALETSAKPVSVVYTSSWNGGHAGSKRMPLGDFMKKDLCTSGEAYIFSEHFFGESVCTFGVTIPTWLNDRIGTPCQNFLAVGGRGAGLGFHTHLDAWNGVIRGSKQWYLFPPGHSAPGGYAEMSTSVWLKQMGWRENISKPIELSQKAGEIVYVPESWHHAVKNTDACTVAVSFQSYTMRTQIERDRTRLQSIRDEMKSRNQRPSSEELRKIGEELVQTFESMATSWPDLAEAHFLLSGAYADVHEYRRAKRAIDAALALDPYYVAALVRKATLLARHDGDDERSSPVGSRALQIDALVARAVEVNPDSSSVQRFAQWWTTRRQQEYP
eukprot:g430.t1